MSSTAAPVTLALVGSGGSMGREIMDALAAAQFPGSALTLLDLEDHVGLLTEYGEEARVVVEAAAESVEGHGLVCFCGTRRIARELIPAVVRSGGVAVDATGATWTDSDAVLVSRDRAGGVEALSGQVLTLPHPATMLLADLASALPGQIEGSTATILLPSTERAEEGPAELAAQAAALLSFGEMPVETLGRRLAFDAAATDSKEALPALIVAQLAAVQIVAPRLATVRIGVFHGLAAAVNLPSVAPSVVRKAVRNSALALDLKAGRAALDSPASLVAAGQETSVSVQSDGRDGTSIWAVQDSYRLTAKIVAALALAHAGQSTH